MPLLSSTHEHIKEEHGGQRNTGQLQPLAQGQAAGVHSEPN